MPSENQNQGAQGDANSKDENVRKSDDYTKNMWREINESSSNKKKTRRRRKKPASVQPVSPMEPVGPPQAFETPQPVDPVEAPQPVEPVVEPQDPSYEFSDTALPEVDSVGKVDEKATEKIVVETEVIDVGVNEENVIAGHVEPVEEELSENEREIEEFTESFWDILEQAGITKGKLIWFFIIVMVIAVMIFGFVFGWFGKIMNFEIKSDSVVEQVGEVEDDPDVTVSEANNFGIMSSYIFGLESTLSARPKFDIEPITSYGDLSGLDAAYAIGVDYDPYRVKFVYYVSLLRNMENIYNTDVYHLMDMSLNRRTAINAHLTDMYELILNAEAAVVEMEVELARLERQYEDVISEKALHEDSFFLSMDQLLGQDAYDFMQLFISLEQEAAEVKALYNSYVTVGDMMLSSIDFLSPRYDDILVNTEALIKGVKIFDIPGSDIDAIIPLEP